MEFPSFSDFTSYVEDNENTLLYDLNRFGAGNWGSLSDEKCRDISRIVAAACLSLMGLYHQWMIEKLNEKWGENQ